MGGSMKIDSVQNVITLRSDLHDAWDNYEFEFGVDPNVSFMRGVRYIFRRLTLHRTIMALPRLQMGMQISMAGISN